eukprot:TRINITY_DN17476_c0_g1_i1.p1 TRINITY_DN17476_c0_g1~~TRINITY_DN17476_c0_g1_i1.p1  ORF type:complete len:151 (+),score=25.91 TRINITY_DN17476_c0_g1_i1:175-627(+)
MMYYLFEMGVLWWLLVLILSGVSIFITVFVVVSIVDLQANAINPINMCKRANPMVVREFILHAVITFIFLINGYYIEFLINLPVDIFNVIRYRNRHHLFDATTVFHASKREQKIGLIKLGVYVVLFFLYLYRFVFSLVKTYGMNIRKAIF